MVTRAGYLRTRYGGYLHREVPEEDAELSHVGPDTPCGEYLRRFWQPICFSDELEDLPHRVKILGEELVVFRDLSGVVGLLELHCPHRGASLEFGLIDAKGIRCCYHGWQFAADGTILETPGEPAHSTLKDRLYHGAYPTHEYGGIVFAYMGPPDRRPPFPGVRQLCPARLSPHAGAEILLPVQLAADHGKRHGSRPYGVSPHHHQRLPIHQRVRGNAGTGVRRRRRWA